MANEPTWDDIIALSERLSEMRFKEINEIRNFAEARASLERERALIVQAAYDAGEIDTKNKDTREAGESDVLAQNEKYQDHLNVTLAYERAVAEAKVRRQNVEDLASLMKTWLYSLTRIGGVTEAHR